MRPTVQLKLLAAFGVLLALIIAVGALALVRLGSENRHLTRLASTVVPSTRTVGEINALMNKYRKDQLHYIAAKPSDRPLGVPGSISEDLAEDLSKMKGYLGAYRSGRLIEDPADRALIDRFEGDFARYVALSAPFASLADHGQTLRASEAVGNGASDEEWNALKQVISEWSAHKVSNAKAAAAASRANYEGGVALILVLLVAAVLIALAVAITMARRITCTVREIGAAAKAIAEGDIDQRVDVRSADEFGAMAEDFDAMVEYLRSTVTIAEAIAAGDLEVEVTPRSERDALGHSLVTMTESLRRLIAENERLLAASREEAHTDSLTALRNRRALMGDLEQQLAEASEARPRILALFDLNGFKQYNDTFGHPSGDALLTRLGERLRGALEGSGVAYRMGGDEFCVLANADAKAGAAIARRAANALSEKGEAFTIDCSYGVAHLPRDASSSSDALRVADQRMYEHKAGRGSASRESSDVLVKVLDEHSPGISGHIGEVAQLAKTTAERLGLPEAEVTRVELAAELHDIGKVAIPDSILSKAGPLDAEEWDFMRRHCEVGERIVSAALSLGQTAELVRLHHERYDGRGYPDGLAGEEIPFGASIIAVCDSFSAMITARPYSDAMSVADAITELRRCAGSQFHPQVVDAFCQLVEEPERVSRASSPRD